MSSSKLSFKYSDPLILFNGDKTSPLTPLLFWVNNDYDVVNNLGVIDLERVNCPFERNPSQQVCEQWDEIPVNSKHNTSSENILVIESERDLEDFQPLLLSVPNIEENENGDVRLPEGYTLSIKAKNVYINLFRGVWNEGTDYLTDTFVMTRQVSTRLIFRQGRQPEDVYAFKLGNEQEKVFTEEEISMFFSRDGKAKFIFEGYQPSPEDCSDQTTNCYIEITLKKNGRYQSKQRIHMQLYDVKNLYDHHTIGTGEAQNGGVISPLAMNINQTGNANPFISTHRYININKGQPNELTGNYIIFVHGWRVQFGERIHLAETAFKRLFLSGYTGRFGTYTWPTGYFELPAHIYDEASKFITYIRSRSNDQNYGLSEAAARMSGMPLANLLSRLNQNFTVHAFAHSMGNVVVSEALRFAGDTLLVEDYVASQAAEVASAYNRNSNWMDLDLPQSIPQGLIEDFRPTANDVESAWRAANSDPGTPFDMPPNHYTFDVPARHGPTVPTSERKTAEDEGWRDTYYHTIGSAAGDIINFHNQFDAALTAWELQQITKPDLFGGPTWDYRQVISSVEDSEEGKRRDLYLRDGDALSFSRDLPITIDSANILGHIIPSRTGALGQFSEVQRITNEFDARVSVIDRSRRFDFYGLSNQGHTAQFYSFYNVRRSYWDSLITEFGLRRVNQ